MFLTNKAFNIQKKKKKKKKRQRSTTTTIATTTTSRSSRSTSHPPLTKRHRHTTTTTKKQHGSSNSSNSNTPDTTTPYESSSSSSSCSSYDDDDDDDDDEDEVHWDNSKHVDLRQRAGLEEFSSQAVLRELEKADDDECDDDDDDDEECDNAMIVGDEENTFNQHQQQQRPTTTATSTSTSFRHRSKRLRRPWMNTTTTTTTTTPHHRHPNSTTATTATATAATTTSNNSNSDITTTTTTTGITTVRTLLPATGGAVDFAVLLEQLQTPSPKNHTNVGNDVHTSANTTNNTIAVNANTNATNDAVVNMSTTTTTTNTPSLPLHHHPHQPPQVNTPAAAASTTKSAAAASIAATTKANNNLLLPCTTAAATTTTAQPTAGRATAKSAATSASSAPSSSPQFFGGAALELSAEDLAAMDRLVEQHYSLSSQQQQQQQQQNQMQRDQQQQLQPQSQQQQHQVVKPAAVASSSSSSTTSNDVKYVAEQKQQPDNRNNADDKEDEEEDPFGEFPNVDFAALDECIAAATQAAIGCRHDNVNNDDNDKSNHHQSNHNTVSAQSSSYTTTTTTTAQSLMTNNTTKTTTPTPSNCTNKNNNNNKNTPSFLDFTRYMVIQVDRDDNSYSQTVSVALWVPDMIRWRCRHHIIPHKRPFTLPSSLPPPNGDISKQQQCSWPAVYGQVILCGEWYHTPLEPGDIVHVVSLYSTVPTNKLPLVLDTTMTNDNNTNNNNDLVLVVHPDLLLTPTTISETVACPRRAILKNRLGSTGLTDKAPLLGTMRHELFEETLTTQDLSPAAAQAHINVIVRRHAEELLACGVSSHEASNELNQFFPQLQRFVNDFTSLSSGGKPTSGGSILENHLPSQTNIKFLAQEVKAIEEPIISPQLGLKGNLDMIVQASLNDGASVTTLGVELKTGHMQKTQNAHMAQLCLYILLLQTQLGKQRQLANGAAESGVLLYMNQKDTRAVHVAPILAELKSLIGQRNMLAIEQVRSSRPRGIDLKYQDDQNGESIVSVHVRDPTPAVLPDLLNSTHACSRCYTNRACMTYAAAARKPNELKSHGALMDEFTGHLSEKDLEYFAKWDRLIDLEADAGETRPPEAWLIDSETRETTTSKCISSVVFDASCSSSQGEYDGTSFALITFQRSPTSKLQVPMSSLSFEPGSHVIVSADRTTARNVRPGEALPRMHIVRGFVHRIAETTISVRGSAQDLKRIQRITKNDTDGSETQFRLDRDEGATGTGTLRQNLVNLFTGGPALSQGTSSPSQMWPTRLPALRDVVVRSRPPQYDPNASEWMFSPMISDAVPLPDVPGCDIMCLAVEFAELNPDQMAAAEKVMAMKDYSLIQGLPGTGKSSIITFVARLLAAHGKRVLISGYTHAAVDNIMLKLMEKGLAYTSETRPSPALIRVGKQSSCHPGVRSVLATEAAMAYEPSSISVGDQAFAAPSVESLRKTIQAARIVGVTALSAPRSPLLLGEAFDVVIVDEAGQISQPAVLGPLMSADSFVLVGDHLQLPPLTVSELASEGGFNVSLLKQLADSHPESIAQLTLQYRMNEEICQLGNDVVYKGTLKCANVQVAHRRLDLPGFPENIPQTAMKWLSTAMDPSQPVIFLDTDAIQVKGNTIDSEEEPEKAVAYWERSSGRSKGGSIVNDMEAKIVSQLVDAFMKCGLEASSVGVVCPFRAQLLLMDESASLHQYKQDGLEISTIDRYQGRDKPAIVLSFVRSNPQHKVGRLLEDVRRLNVAITRAKCKLVLVGSFTTLWHGSETLRPVFERLRRQERVIAIDQVK